MSVYASIYMRVATNSHEVDGNRLKCADRKQDYWVVKSPSNAASLHLAKSPKLIVCTIMSCLTPATLTIVCV